MVRLFKQKYQYKKYTQNNKPKPWINTVNNSILKVTGSGLYNVNLYDVLKQSYEKNPNLDKYGFTIHHNLSSNNYQTYFKDSTKQLLFVIKGTNMFSLNDIATDVYLAIGNLKSTKRLKQAADALQKAKDTLHPLETAIAGHSLGGAIAQYIASGSDKVITLDKGATIGQPTRSNETAYRTSGDIVSALAKNTITLKNPNLQIPGLNLYNTYKAHDIENIKNSNLIF
jgi:hypothetical protein